MGRFLDIRDGSLGNGAVANVPSLPRHRKDDPPWNGKSLHNRQTRHRGGVNEKGRLPKEPPLINHLTVPGFLNPRMPARTPYPVEPSLP